MTNKAKVLVIVLLAIAMISSVVVRSAYSATGYAWIGGVADDAPYDLSADHSGLNWSWSATENKLTLDSGYLDFIFIDCNYDDVINLEINGDVTISNGIYGSALNVLGSLNVYGTGTLTLVPSELGAQYSVPTITTSKNLVLSGATLIVNANEELNRAIVVEYGDVLITGSAKIISTANGKRGYALYSNGNVKIDENAQVELEGTGVHSAGIIVKSGDVTVADNASLKAKGIGEGYAVEVRNGSIIINNDNVTLLADDDEHVSSVPLQGTGKVNTVTPDKPVNSSKSGGGGCTVFGFGVGILFVAALALKMVKEL